MRNHTILITLLAALSSTSCKSIECGDGTIERDGTCAPASTTTGATTCGPFTELQGDRCVPMFPPTECDFATTTPSRDPETGVVTCIGTGGGGCGAPFACPTPTEPNRITVCGQIYNFETQTRFQGVDPSGTACNPDAPTTTGPCALEIRAYDAVPYASNPATAVPRPVDVMFIDDCGRYRLVNIDTNGTSPFIGLGIDDRGAVGDPGGVTVPVGVATGKFPSSNSGFEVYVVPQATTQKWADSGGPLLSDGIYAASYRKHRPVAGADLRAMQEGVTFAHSNGTTYASQDHYFLPAQTTNETIDPGAMMTGMNGTALVVGRSLSESVSFVGQGGLGADCRWESHAAVSLAGIVFIQIYRKTDLSMPGTCLD